jgi:AraC-like DNA-binding protein
VPELVDTSRAAAADRFDLWVAAISKIIFPLRIQRLGDAPFAGRVAGYGLGPLEVLRVAGDANICARTDAGIRHSDPECIQLHVLRRGTCQVSQQDRASLTVPGDIMTQDSSHPYVIRADQRFEYLVFNFPKVLLGSQLKRVSEHTALRVPGNSGLGSRISPFLSGLVDGLEDGSVPENDVGLADSMFGLLRALYRGEDSPVVHGGDRPSIGLLAHVKSFIENHLHEPELGPERIAAAHFISTRYLHKLFETEDVSVSRWVQQRRLDRCRRDLSDPALAERRIEAIASRWGFGNPDHFSRTFRTTYGCSPRELRAWVLHAVANHPEDLAARVIPVDPVDEPASDVRGRTHRLCTESRGVCAEAQGQPPLVHAEFSCPLCRFDE